MNISSISLRYCCDCCRDRGLWIDRDDRSITCAQDSSSAFVQPAQEVVDWIVCKITQNMRIIALETYGTYKS